MQYWQTYQKNLIQEFVSGAFRSSEEMTIWQQDGDSRVTFHGKIIFLEKQLVKINVTSQVSLIIEKMPLFFHIPNAHVIFKKDNYSIVGNIIEISMPSYVQVNEKRKIRRFYYKYQDHKNITYHSLLMNQKTGKPNFTKSSILVDISINGAGLVVNGQLAKSLNKNDYLFLTNITDQKLPAPFKVKILYISKYNYKEEDLFKVGIVFEDALESVSYKSISNIIEVKQKKALGLSQDLYCGLTDEEIVNKVNTIDKTNRILASNIKDNIEYIDRLRYLTTQMKIELLQDINQDLLAIALRLSSKELIYDLFSDVTVNMQNEFLEKLQVQRPASAISKAQDHILKTIRAMESSGKIILDPTIFTTYV